MKLPALVAVFTPTATVTVPVVAPKGTVVVILVEVLLETVAAVPLKLTILLAGVVLKLVPLIVTADPMPPLGGVIDVIVGTGGAAGRFESWKVGLFTSIPSLPLGEES